jgi:putative ABC transport system permease protein
MLAFQYNLRNVFVRWRSTATVIFIVALIVTVYLLTQAMASGLEKSSQNTGDPRNVMIVRKGSPAESSSIVTREQFQLIQFLPMIERDEKGQPLISADLVNLINLPRREGGEANVTLRGVTAQGVVLRPQVKLISGRWFNPGHREVVVSRKMAERFANCGLGESFKTGLHKLTVVGWFDGGNSAFDSEMWMDADEARALFDRESFSSFLARVSGAGNMLALSNRLEADKRMTLTVDSEVAYYGKQTMTAQPLRFMGALLATAMSIGAMFAAMNTMYASIAARTREIGTLRVLGFRRRTVLGSFILEGAMLSLLGGLLGCALALLAQWACLAFGVRFGTMSFNTFSEMIFQFQITPPDLISGLIFALAVGVIGSLPPAIRAARMPAIQALKAV